MSRRRPELKNWNDRVMHTASSMSPREWVGKMLLNEGRPVWRTWGEIREAIRRELERRGAGSKPAAAKASIMTVRGLRQLDERAQLRRRAGKYSVHRAALLEGLTQLMLASAMWEIDRRRAVFYVSPPPKPAKSGIPVDWMLVLNKRTRKPIFSVRFFPDQWGQLSPRPLV